MNIDKIDTEIFKVTTFMELDKKNYTKNYLKCRYM